MRIAIIGCGAMGTVMGALLTKNGCPVDMVDIYQAHVEALNETGAHITGKMDETIPVKALTPDQMEGIYDVAFLFTKQTANDTILPQLLSHLGEDSVVCTLQNGVPEPYVGRYVGEGRTVGGTVLWGATFIGPGESELTQDISKNDHLFEIGEISGEITPRIQKIAEILDHMGRPAKITDALMASRWGKLINNACMSGMSAVCGATFGEVLENPKAAACLSYLGNEVKRCCEAAGYRLPLLLNEQLPDTLELAGQSMYDENQKMFQVMYRDMHTAKASMLQDLEKGRKSEVGMINGYVCEVGRAHGIETSFNDTVVEIIQKIENNRLELSMKNLELFPEGWFVYDRKSI